VNAPAQILPLTDTIQPTDPAAVADAVKSARQSATPIYPLGGGTRLDYGVLPKRPGLGLSLAGLNRVVDYPARDLTITVEAGVTVAELNRRLASERQRLPVDVPQAGRATLGGAVAPGQGGPRRYLWGTLRDYVIGIEAVDGRGTPFSGGGRVVKNAAGYNLCRLLTGSLGTLGVITQVTLMVKPMPETSALVACDVADLDTVEKLLADLVHTETLPAAVELLVGEAWCGDPALATESQSAAARLVVGFEGTSAEVDWMVEHLPTEWQRVAGVSATEVRGNAALRVWSRLTEFPVQGSSAGGDAQLVTEISVLPGATVDFIRLLGQVDPGCSIQAHAGDGVLRARFGGQPNEMAAVLNQRVRPAVSKAGGAMVVLANPHGADLSQTDVWGPPGHEAAVLQAIKSGFDPDGILNPDRFVYANR
jgi:glycolate oxidase FAD binding subunit